MSDKLPRQSTDTVSVPNILTIFKACKKYGIEHEMIKSLNYNDLLCLVINFQIDDLKVYFNTQKHQGKVAEVIYPNDEELTLFLYGKVPKGKEVM